MSTDVLFKVERQVNTRIALKKGTRKKIKRLLEKTLVKISRLHFKSPFELPSYSGETRFGADEIGRDVEAGLNAYLKILNDRGLTINAAIVLGSRAKGKWSSNSDIDVTLIGDNLPKESSVPLLGWFLNFRRMQLLSDSPLNMKIEPSGCCTKEEFLKRLSDFKIHALDAILYGQVFYDDGFWKFAQAAYFTLKEEYDFDEKQLRKLILPI